MIFSVSYIRRRTALSGLSRGYIVFIAALCLCFTGCALRESSPQAQNGILDLKGWDFEKDGMTDLNGEWEFYWNRLLTPSDFESGNPPEKDGYIKLPCIWNGYELDGRKLAGKGHATFRLLLRLNGRNKKLSLTARDLLTASRIWIDGELSEWNGTVGCGKDGSDAECRAGITDLTGRSGTTEIVLQVSNYHSIKGGPNLPMYLGTGEQIERRQSVIRAVDAFVIGVLLIMALYHFVLYFFRREYKPVLYFAFISLLLALNNFIYGIDGRFIVVFFKRLPFDLLYRLELVSWYIAVPVIGMFLASLYTEQFSKYVIRSVQLAAAVFVLITIAMPLDIVERTMPVYTVISIGGAAYGTYGLLKAFLKRLEGTHYILAGFVCFFIFAINDLFLINDVGILSVSLANIGWLICIVFQSFALSSIFAKSFKAMEENLKLRTEIAERKRVEQELKLMQIRLSEMLDTITEAVIAVNENSEICFVNSIAVKLTGYSGNDLLGKNIRDIFPDKSSSDVLGIAAHIDEKKEERKKLESIKIADADGTVKDLGLIISTLELEDEPLYIFIFRKPDSFKKDSVTTEVVIEELNRNREKLRNFEETLNILTPEFTRSKPELLNDVKVVDKALEHIQSYLVSDEKLHDKRAMAVEIMNLCLECWNDCTNNAGKIKMAEKSGIWKIYIDKDGGQRTQGLDRYLSLRTISKRPRWRKVIETADFVLINCSGNSASRRKLEANLSQFRILL